MSEIEKNAVYFGVLNFRNSNKLFGIKRKDRRQHMYVIGKTGVGKTALLYNLVVQDIANGEGLCVIDPHGDFVQSLLSKIPEERVKDVVYFNPADNDFHIGFNILEVSNPKHKYLVAAGLMDIFTKIWANVWSARMEYILNNSILALLDTPGSTLLGLSRLLVDKEYRKYIVGNIKDPVVKAFWINEYEEWRDQFRNEAIAPIQNKVGQFLASPIIRNIVGQRKSTIDISHIMNTGKILLVDVSKGKIGEDNSALLGAMLITKMQLAAMERVNIPEDERVDFYLYVDEFQNFATDSFANILSEARKYRLNLIIAHQYIGQLSTDLSTKIKDSVFGNVGTMIAFRVGAQDALFLEKEFSPEFNAEDLVNLPNYHICLKLMVDGVTSRPFSAVTLPPFKLKSNPVKASEIVNISRKLYMRPRYLVEEEINKWDIGLSYREDKKESFSSKKRFLLKQKESLGGEFLSLLGIESQGEIKDEKLIKNVSKKNNFPFKFFKNLSKKVKIKDNYFSQKELKEEDKEIKEEEKLKEEELSLTELKNINPRKKNETQFSKSKENELEELKKSLKSALEKFNS